MLVQGNDIGTDSADDNLGNLAGIVINGVSSNTIGGTAAAAANLIGFNNTGISITGTPSSIGGSTANNNIVWGNFIGTDAANDDLGNKTGIVLLDASDNSIGGTLSGSLTGTTIGAWFSADFSVTERNGLVVDSSTVSGVGNIIGFNTSAGVSISSGGLAMPGNLVIANLIGASGAMASIGNATGVVLTNTGNNSIGESLASLGLEYQNTLGGVLTGSVSALGSTIPLTFPSVSSATLGGTVSAGGGVGNVIVGNSGDGVSVSGSINGANNVEGNLISRNGINGVHLVGNLGGGSSLLQLIENYIGTDPTGTTIYQSVTNQSFGNGFSGVLIEATSSAASTVTASHHLRKRHLGQRLERYHRRAPRGFTSKMPATANVAIEDNFIGTDMSGANVGTSSFDNPLPFGNVLDGIQLDDVSGVTIGAAGVGSGAVSLVLSASLGNLISGNLGRGIEITNGATDNLIGGNLIGVVLASNASGQPTLAAKDSANAASANNSGNESGNLSDGIFLLSSSNNTITGNVISANRGYGIHASDDLEQPRPDVDRI